MFVAVYFVWARPAIQQPIAAPLALPTMELGLGAESDLKPPTNLEAVPVFVEPELQLNNEEIVCGNEQAWNVLLVGIDYRGENYLYGLADVIRVARVDFVNMKVNMIALPRDLVVEGPEGRFTEPNPMKINQAYLLAPKDGRLCRRRQRRQLAGGSHSLQFWRDTASYAVVDFQTVINFIDAIGGVELDLPQAVFDPDPNLGVFRLVRRR